MSPRRPSLEEALETLHREGLTEALEPEAVLAALRDFDSKTGADTPFYVRMLVAGGAWLAGSILLLLVVFLTDLNSPGEFMGMGALAMASGFMLHRARREVYNEFLAQLTLVLIIAGDLLVIVGVWDISGDVELLAGAVTMGLGALMALLCAQVELRSAAFIQVCAGLASLIISGFGPEAADLPQAIVAFAMVKVWLDEGRWQSGPLSAHFAPLSRGLTLAFFVGLLTSLAFDTLDAAVGPPTTIASALLLLWVARRILERAGCGWGGRASLFVIAGIFTVAVLTLNAPGVMGAALALALGLECRSRWLTLGSLLFLAIFVGFFYYQLSIDLLTKSGMLFGTGCLLLTLRLIIPPALDAAGGEV